SPIWSLQAQVKAQTAGRATFAPHATPGFRSLIEVPQRSLGLTTLSAGLGLTLRLGIDHTQPRWGFPW
ncbi:MAG TPA: hypothetical protein DCR93_34470, partial [Cytophagales bacterium]|nr:hypothetical protein [Cytophagales bacterium]